MDSGLNFIQAYELARERYADLGVNTDEALEQLAQIPISLHCWQGDDVGGFENPDQALGGGLMTLSLIHISEPTRQLMSSRMPSCA